MSDLQEKFGVSFEEPAVPEREEIEFVNEDEVVEETKEGKPEVPAVTKEELEELKRKAEMGQQNNEIFSKLGETLERVGGAIGKPINSPPNPVVETEEDFGKKFEENIFARDKGYQTFREAMQREVAPIIHNLQSVTVQQEKRLMALDPEKGSYFKKYANEIEGVVQGLPPGQRVTPGVYEWAYDRVMATKVSEIAKEQASTLLADQVAEAVNKRLREMGIDPESVGKGKMPASRSGYSEAGQETRGQPPRANVKRVVITAADRREAASIGMDIRDYMLTKSVE